QELQYVSLNVQYIDGTKIESAANRYTCVWKGSVEKNKAKLEEKYNLYFPILTLKSKKTRHSSIRTQKNNPFLVQNLYYNQTGDYYVCPMGQRMEHIGKGKRVSINGYEA